MPGPGPMTPPSTEAEKTSKHPLNGPLAKT